MEGNYSATDLSEQGLTGNWNYKLKPVYTICILDFCFDDTPAEQFNHHVALTFVESGRVFSRNMQFYYLEMPKFVKTENKLVTRLDEWCYLLNNIHSLREIPQRFNKDPIFVKVFEIAECSNLTPEEMNLRQQRLKEKRDEYNIFHSAIEKADKEGVEKGIGIGVEKGAHLKALEVVHVMQQQGYPLNDIALISGLPLDEVKKALIQKK